MEPIVLIHGYSSEGPTNAETLQLAGYAGIYGDLPKRIRERSGTEIVDIDLSRWISLDDGVSIDDISDAMHRALIAFDGGRLLKTGFNVIIHSTGALVARNWVRRHWDPTSECKARRIIYLAGANWGSGWAHLGQAEYSKWVRSMQHVQRGTRVLDALELASDWTVDLHLEVERKKHAGGDSRSPMEFSIVGTQHELMFSMCPIRYAREDGSDGVVRVTGCNLNFNYLKIRATEKAKAEAKAMDVQQHDLDTGVLQSKTDYEIVEQRSIKNRKEIPFAIPYDTAHNGTATGVVSGINNEDQVMRLIMNALGTVPETMDDSVAFFRKEMENTYDRVRSLPENERVQTHLVFFKRSIPQNYEGHAQVIFRIVDQYKRPVKDCSVYFNSLGHADPTTVIDAFFEDKHRNVRTPHTSLLFLRVQKFAKDKGEYILDNGKLVLVDRMPLVNGVTLEVDGNEPDTTKVGYLDIKLEIDKEHLVEYIRPHETTIIDIELARIPDASVFVLNPAPQS